MDARLSSTGPSINSGYQSSDLEKNLKRLLAAATIRDYLQTLQRTFPSTQLTAYLKCIQKSNKMHFRDYYIKQRQEDKVGDFH